MNMMLMDLFREYESLVAKADQIFSDVQREHGSCVRCDVQCADCCHSVFGLFLIESVYLNYYFSRLEEKIRQGAVARGDQADRELQELEKRMQALDDPEKIAVAVAGEKIRCPLLSDEEKCLLYERRPITCRVYGIPTIINGKLHACWRAGFEKGKHYPAFNLDAAHRELYRLSGELVDMAGLENKDRASYLVSVSKSIKSPVLDLIDLENAETGRQEK